MSTIQLKKFSEELKKAREESNLTLQMLHQKTRIDIKFLEALETGNFEIIDEVYLRAFIRSYSNTIGLNETEQMKKYDLAKSGKLIDDIKETDGIEETEDDPQNTQKKVVFTSENISAPQIPEKDGRKINSKFIIIPFAALIVIAALYFFLFRDNSQEIIKEPAAPSSTQSEPPVQRFEVIGRDTSDVSEDKFQFSDPADTTKRDSLILEIDASARTWVRSVIDQGEQSEFILQINESAIIKAASTFSLLIGNAGGIDLRLNGVELDLKGNLGEIKSVTIDSTGIQYLRINKPGTNEEN